MMNQAHVAIISKTGFVALVETVLALMHCMQDRGWGYTTLRQNLTDGNHFPFRAKLVRAKSRSVDSIRRKNNQFKNYLRGLWDRHGDLSTLKTSP